MGTGGGALVGTKLPELTTLYTIARINASNVNLKRVQQSVYQMSHFPENTHFTNMSSKHALHLMSRK